MPKAPKKSGLSQKLKKAGVKAQKAEPVWKGPEVDGITQSLLSRFLVCRERFRVLVVEGLQPSEGWNHRLGYGNMWHVCEEAFAESGNPIVSNPVATTPWERALLNYARQQVAEHRTESAQIDKWYNVCKVQFPEYVKHWKNHPDVKNRTPLLQEQVFAVPYELPSGRTVIMKGKWDSVDLIKTGRNQAVWLQENKTKGDIIEHRMMRQLTFDLQTMWYLVALKEHMDRTAEEVQDDQTDMGWLKYPVAGVRYNVIRRPLAGGKGSIKQRKPTKSNPNGETKEEYYKRLQTIIAENRDYFFMRWNVTVLPADIERFKTRFLEPVLESLCDWWAWVQATHGRDHVWSPAVRVKWKNTQTGETREFGREVHWQCPFGLYNPLLEGNPTDLDEYLLHGSTTGLEKADNLFPEL